MDFALTWVMIGFAVGVVLLWWMLGRSGPWVGCIVALAVNGVCEGRSTVSEAVIQFSQSSGGSSVRSAMLPSGSWGINNSFSSGVAAITVSLVPFSGGYWAGYGELGKEFELLGNGIYRATETFGVSVVVWFDSRGRCHLRVNGDELGYVSAFGNDWEFYDDTLLGRWITSGGAVVSAVAHVTLADVEVVVPMGEGPSTAPSEEEEPTTQPVDETDIEPLKFADEIRSRATLPEKFEFLVDVLETSAATDGNVRTKLQNCVSWFADTSTNYFHRDGGHNYFSGQAGSMPGGEAVVASGGFVGMFGQLVDAWLAFRGAFGRVFDVLRVGVTGYLGWKGIGNLFAGYSWALGLSKVEWGSWLWKD